MRNIGIYIHVPFCDGKCYYCNFFSRNMTDDIIDNYVTELNRSIRAWGNKLYRPVDTVYFGGGTPSLLGHRRLIDVLDTVKASFDVDENAEITVEVNPSSSGELDFSALREAGFNRLSIGMQSANENELKLLGRRHSVDDAKRTVSAAQAAGFDNISLDVMLAIPEQTMDSLHRTLDFCAACQVQHISAYILKIEPGTRFYRMRDSLPLFDDDCQAAFYEETVRYLKQLGYEQYEISNFAKDGCVSRHNIRYWHDEEYIGIGPSAHSFIDDKRFYYDNSFEDFYAKKIIDEGSGGDEEEYIMLALRLSEGLVFRDFADRFGHPVSEKIIKSTQPLIESGLVRIDDVSLSLTMKGFLVSNAVIGYLLDNGN